MDERTIQILAHHLIKLQGNRAVGVAFQCIEGAAESRDDHGVLLWNGVRRVIEEWESQRQKLAH
jgi:hypothetical protein